MSSRLFIDKLTKVLQCLTAKAESQLAICKTQEKAVNMALRQSFDGIKGKCFHLIWVRNSVEMMVAE